MLSSLASGRCWSNPLLENILREKDLDGCIVFFPYILHSEFPRLERIQQSPPVCCLLNARAMVS